MIFKFEPIYKERVWGGAEIRNYLGRDTPPSNHLGESWEIVDRKEDNSVVSNTDFKGLPLRELLRKEADQVMGPGWPRDLPFPLLVKWLDCSQRLSLQVHPPAEVAERLGGEPKTENWYVAKATEDAGLFIGLRRNTSPEAFHRSLAENTAESLCHRVSSRAGDSILVESGRMHAIDAGNLILEIQQNSDTTYRVYDWDREGLDGRPRELHVENSMQCIDFTDFEPSPIHTSEEVGFETIADSKFFRIRKLNLAPDETVELKEAEADAALIHALGNGLLVDGEPICKGEQALSPYFTSCSLSSPEETSVLVTDRFSVNMQDEPNASGKFRMRKSST